VAEVPGGTTEGYYAMTSVLLTYPDDPRPEAQGFIKKYKALYGKDPNLAAQIGYTGAQLLILGLQRAGRDLTVDSFITGMESIKDYQDVFGSPKMTYGPQRRQGSTESFLAVVHNGRWAPVSTQPIGY
jgi:branched-chain amino acid transport system substrate-binding protein